ncbi:MAG: D-alanyl-D-alanine carboxypeptidase/D-alanyl-D-alanine-endopeptidase [Gammaproteobacteria bacterium]|nr:D-alanyl-D-alanine carboxypeptidase/D-alanyl-D-alanine-endopeptidase [Gammaproteobacteria bacterium]
MLAATGAHAAGFEQLAGLRAQGAEVSALAVDLDNGRTLASLSPQTRLTPASLTKLVTAAAALDHWAADQTFPTRLLTSGRIVGDRLDGDLVLQGDGNATLDDQGLWTLAAQLAGTGVRQIHGRLLVVPAPFGPVPCETEDRCKATTRSDSAYDAPLSSIGVDFGAWCLDVRPTAPGQPAAVRGCAVTKLPLPVVGEIRTVAPRARQTFWLERVTAADGDTIRVGGDIPGGRPVRMFRAMSDPARGAALLLQEILRETGITLSGGVAVAPPLVANATRTLASFDGMPLREQLGRMLRYSNNYIADVLTLDLAAATLHPAPAQLAQAGQALSSFVAYTRRGGRDPPLPSLYSGSGLTPESQMSADDLVDLLRHEYLDTRDFPVFYGSLVVPRQAPFAFLRRGSRAWLDRVALKTGTMDDPRSVFGIAGYLRKQDSGWAAFAILVNGSDRRKHIPLYRALAAARADVESLLAGREPATAGLSRCTTAC